ncbi:MAG: hypothetical protein LBP96_01340, partial [Bacteroidales bacterium]|nr:hypothetical protein [Bacteroidales bacterium]
MNTLFSIEFWSAYMLPSATSLAVFYLLYKGLVRNDTHLNTRRFTILGILVFSMLLPFLNFQMPMNVVNAGALRTIPLQNLILELPIFTVFADANSVANLGAEHASPIPIFSILGWIYMLVVLLLVGRGLVGILRLAAFSKNGKRLPTEDATIVSSPNIPTAFSFFKTVFIP